MAAYNLRQQQNRRFWCCCSLLPVLILLIDAQAQQQNQSQDVSTLLKIKPALDTNPALPLLLSWSFQNPLCNWQGVQWMLNDGTPVNCSVPATALNDSLAQDPSILVESITLTKLQGALVGTIPPEIGLLSGLRKLELSSNNLTGPIPEEISNASSLAFIHLGNNRLNGSIPSTIWKLCGVLAELDLDHNQLSGSIPVAADPKARCSNLTSLRLNSNNLSGLVPSEFLKSLAPSLTELDLSNNILLGGVVAAPGATSIQSNAAAPATSPALVAAPSTGSSKLSAGAVSGIIIGVLVATVLLLSLLIGICSSNRSPIASKLTTSPSLHRELDEAEDATTGKLVAFEGGERFNADQVLNASGEVLGKTSYGTVYKAKLQAGPMITLRLLRDGSVKDRDEFVSAVKELGLIRHRNLVPLRAYYHGPKDEKLLVYDYIPKGNLQELIHRSTAYAPAPSWAIRHKIALGAARGLGHLHTGLHLPLLHGNLKSKNILVDENFEPHLSDFGLHLLMNAAASNEMITAQATQGYKAPELTRIKKANTKTDIYSFGIILLELLTGKKPGNLAAGDNDSVTVVDLPTLVKTAVIEERTAELFDLDLLRGLRSPMEDGLLQALQLAMGCCAPSPAVRPDIKEVIRQLEEIRPKIHSPIFTPVSHSRNSPRIPLSPLRDAS
ncbi:hypothetical protein SELMODRAFT_173095 [Selaginella moellendorffii]|uniref:Protein kinase domain-containing protein n=1 Tax=Selaginella moellendorffii TaxID=88036 RepID=D8RP74_SELML|nr:putative kinase-like protein TMKL1 [Selaginella moellendorffii]EFJ25986.1 hypothetical protein SELMODRAFT_173095 [Selaginella moellendorffii]|eukprot:XP_002972765.1 putative kinase-like protein TMKL1 [Selaginella moellendorffii]